MKYFERNDAKSQQHKEILKLSVIAALCLCVQKLLT